VEFFFSLACTIFAAQSIIIMNLLNVLLDTTPGNSASHYLPIAIQLVFAVGFVATMMILTHMVGPKRKTTDKLENFASGIESHGDARQPLAIKYFLVAILFVLFDVEVIFMYPWAVNFEELAMPGFIQMVLFITTLLVGFFYILKKGALKWED